MKSAFKGVVFWIGQKDVEAQLTVNKAVELRQKFQEMQNKYIEKLQQVHAGYQKAVKKVQALQEENESLLKDRNELQEKYAEKSRQKRKLEDMYETLRGEYEKVKRSALTTVPPSRPQPFHKATLDFTAAVPSGFDDPRARDPERSMEFLGLAPSTPSHSNQFWAARQKPVTGLFDEAMPNRPSGRARDQSGRHQQSEGADPSLFTLGGGIKSTGIRNLLLSPMKRPPTRLPPTGFSS
ncbi:hypothetical protein R1flu_020010 [Riccia fluitans]|uniref:E3 ubiquitin-protein ligase CCNB1IP1 n=1 Tax=Riccia fluitans TaxID=41844 RepID=A0ABD1ZKQ4_9MARC